MADSQAFLDVRDRLPHGGMLREDADIGAKPAPGDWACSFGHEYEMCRCHQPAGLMGDDESIFKQVREPAPCPP